MCRDPAPVGLGQWINYDGLPSFEDDPASFWGPRPIFRGELLVSGSVAVVICVCFAHLSVSGCCCTVTLHIVFGIIFPSSKKGDL